VNYKRGVHDKQLTIIDKAKKKLIDIDEIVAPIKSNKTSSARVIDEWRQ
jgi:hypothetical protein